MTAPLRLGLSLAGLALALVMPLVLTPYSLRVLVLALISAIAVLGLLFAFGYAGLVHLGQAAFVGIGAYATALMSTRFGLGFWSALPIALVGAALMSLAIGAPLLRLRGHYLALATVGLNVTIEIVLKNWTPVTGGDDGISGIPGIGIGALAIDSDRKFYYLAAGAVLVTALAAAAIRSSRFGRAMIAVRDDELAAGAAGVVVFRVKLLAFTLAGVYGALSGTLYAHYAGYIAPSDFDGVKAITLLVMLIVGGETAIVGAIGGCILISFAPEWLRFVGAAYLTVFGIAIILVLVAMPNGIMGLLGGIPALRPARRAR